MNESEPSSENVERTIDVVETGGFAPQPFKDWGKKAFIIHIVPFGLETLSRLSRVKSKNWQIRYTLSFPFSSWLELRVLV
jgi:hypothetical protein